MIEVCKYEETIGIIASLYGMSTLDFLGRTLNGEMHGVMPERMPTQEERQKVDNAWHDFPEDLRKLFVAERMSKG